MDTWPAESICESIVGWLPGFSVEIVPEIDSTNSALIRRARAGQVAPILLAAESQTAGRGRLGRSWHSTAADHKLTSSLTFSLGLALAPRDWSGLSLAVGVSLAQSLDPQKQHGITLKWPNDLWLSSDGADAKLAGVLVETIACPFLPARTRYVVIGIGVNLGARSEAGLTLPAAAWQNYAPNTTAPSVLAQVAAPLVRAVQQFETAGFAPFQSTFALRDALFGRQVDVRQEDGVVLRSGIACGIDETGALLLKTKQGLQTITSSEVSVRPS